jgi:hypothetical protein
MRAQVTCFQNLHIATTVTKNWVHTTARRMATHRKSDRRRDDLCADALRKSHPLRLPKRIGLRSNIRLSGVLVKMSWITLPDVSTHLRPG